MSLITWSDSLSVNVAEIDRQHQKLVAMINDLNDRMKQGKGKDVLGKIVSDLMAYAISHFATEEKYFDRFGYPEAPNHKAEHLAFAEKVSSFHKDFSKGRIGLSIDVMMFLSDWLRSHIQGSDKQYGPFFNANGLA